jgi:hypothetical protein
MKKVVSCLWSVDSLRKLLSLCLLITSYFLLSCSMPNLESADCAGARLTLKNFYSYHFGGDMQIAPENLQQFEKFLTNDFLNNLRNSQPFEKDPFTLTSDTPKAFRVGRCQVVEPQTRVNFEVLLFWRTDTRSEQREINVEAVKQNDKWLVNKVSESNQK